MISRPFVHRLRARYVETDQMGVVYHAHYLNYFEVGRTEMMRHLGYPYAGMESAGFLLAVVEVGCRYLAAARYDDWLRIETRAEILSPLRVRFHSRVVREEGEVAVAEGEVDLVCLGPDRQPRRLPEEARRRLEAFAVGE